MPKPQKKRLKPRAHIEAESDAYDLVRRVFFVVFHAHKPKHDGQEHYRAIMRGRDPHDSGA